MESGEGARMTTAKSSAQALREAREVAVARNETETVEPALVHQVHGVDHQRDIGRVLPRRVAALLVLQDSDELLGGYDAIPTFLGPCWLFAAPNRPL